MPKKILIVTGSPRRDGNSDALAAAFTRGAETVGAEVRRVDAASLDIKACTACGKCWTGGAPCVFSDDMEQAYPLMEWADMFVFAFPLYYYTFPAQIKVFLDKFYPYEFQNTEVITSKDAALLVCGGTDDRSEFDGVVATYKIICNYKGWNDRGVICADSVNDKGDIAGTDWPGQAQTLGESLR